MIVYASVLSALPAIAALWAFLASVGHLISGDLYHAFTSFALAAANLNGAMAWSIVVSEVSLREGGER